MNHPPSILGMPPAAPPSTTTQEERLLAAAAYLGHLTGFWLVVPIAVYVLKREQSRFVAHHAVRAILLHLAAVPVVLFGWILAALANFALVLVLDDGGRSTPRGAEAAFLVVTILAWALPWLAYFGICVLGALRALQGRVDVGSLLGRAVERLLARDSSVGVRAAQPPAAAR